MAIETESDCEGVFVKLYSIWVIGATAVTFVFLVILIDVLSDASVYDILHMRLICFTTTFRFTIIINDLPIAYSIVYCVFDQ